MIDLSRLRAPSRFVTIAAVLLALLWFAMLTVGTGTADDDLYRALYAGGRPLLVWIAYAFTTLGSAWVTVPLGLAAFGYLAWARRKEAAIVTFVVIMVGRLLVEAQKYSIGRFRPEDEVHLVPVSTPSFPSGHSANSMIVCLTLAIVFFGHTRWRYPAAALAVLLSVCIGISRIMLGVHWPTDVIGGWAFGLLWVMLALPQVERLAKVREIG
jgi:undecaprenyl-diphosphatase